MFFRRVLRNWSGNSIQNVQVWRIVDLYFLQLVLKQQTKCLQTRGGQARDNQRLQLYSVP